MLCFIRSELSAQLAGSMAKVLEDYDVSRCQVLYSDDALPRISSARSDAVSVQWNLFIDCVQP